MIEILGLLIFIASGIGQVFALAHINDTNLLSMLFLWAVIFAVGIFGLWLTV